MIVGATPLVADAPRPAHVAVLHGLGVVRGCDRIRLLLRGHLEAGADEPEVGREVLDVPVAFVAPASGEPLAGLKVQYGERKRVSLTHRASS